jgi:choline-sulfatase
MTALLLVAALAAPDVFLISVDTLRADHLGCYGYPHNTSPVLDRFARDGLLFEDCLVEVPLTNPSFGAMLSSRYPRMTGVVRNGLPMPADVPLVAELFRSAGYQTVCVQSNWTLKGKLSGLNRGFDVYEDDFHKRRWGFVISERYAEKVTDIALDMLRDRDADRPLFLWAHYSDPHAPYRFHTNLNPSGEAYEDAGKIGQTRKRYDSEIAYADRHIGRLLEAIPKDAYVLFVADHGESLYEHDYLGHGRRIYQTCIRVPLILRGPGIQPGRSDAPVRILDVGPTLLDFADIDPAPGMLGHSLLGEDPGSPTRFIETYGGAVPQLPGAKALMADRPPMRQGVVHDGYKLILHDGRPELYHLVQDPLETKDLAEAEPGRIEELRALLDDFNTHTGTGQTEQAPLDEQDIDALKSLGYIE